MSKSSLIEHYERSVAEFGDLEPAPAGTTTHEFDDRRPESGVFVVKTGDGGTACLRIAHRETGTSTVTIDYVYLPGKR